MILSILNINSRDFAFGFLINGDVFLTYKSMINSLYSLKFARLSSHAWRIDLSCKKKKEKGCIIIDEEEEEGEGDGWGEEGGAWLLVKKQNEANINYYMWGCGVVW